LTSTRSRVKSSRAIRRTCRGSQGRGPGFSANFESDEVNAVWADIDGGRKVSQDHRLPPHHRRPPHAPSATTQSPNSPPLSSSILRTWGLRRCGVPCLQNDNHLLSPFPLVPETVRLLSAQNGTRVLHSGVWA
jgi:hypothetical protein